MVDGAEYASYDIEYGASITLIDNPEKEGYTFSGWSDAPATMPSHDVQITGTFEAVPAFATEDVNHDGLVDTQDVLDVYNFMQNATAGETNPTLDVNNDGNVDTQDVLAIYDYISKN